MALSHGLQALNKGAWHPEDGMKPKEAEGADQQTGHGPEGVKEEGVLILVLMGSVGQISCKAQIRIRMTG